MDRFNYASLRAREARAAKIFNHFAVKLLLGIFDAGLIFGFFYLTFYLHNSLGWLLLAVAIFVTIFLVWTVKELAHIPPGPSEDINDLLSGNVLRILKPDSTPQSLTKELYKTRSGTFLALRFGLTPRNLEFFAAEAGDDLAPIFATAREIWRQVDGETISGGMIAVAIVQHHPNHEMLLKQLRLDLKDLYMGIVWYNYLHGLVKDARRHRRDGGIARDFSFGYIPTLQRFGHNLSLRHAKSSRTQVHLAAHREIVEKMLTIFSGNGRQNVALIGPNGCGRSTIVDAFAEEILDADAPIPSSLKYRQIFVLDAASLISAASARGQIERLMMQILGEAFAAKNIIICLDNAQLFFEDGVGSVDISNVLLPILEAGKLRVILTMDEQKYLEIAARNSSLANALNKIMVPAANREETMKVLEDQAPVLEYKYGVVCTFWALNEAYRLSERYIHELVMPGQALSLLEAACNYPEDKYVLAESVQEAVEKTQGVKLQVANSENDRAKLLQLEDLIHRRMIDQVAAVRTVSDALRRAAAGVRDTKRPIGTFLFLGPTGVGKTELAKALSEVYFDGEEHIIRLDLNEYVASSDVARLIAEGSENPESLTAQVMKQPFSVVLLDEIEKAHPQVLTTLLQLLDEGILRDSKNHEVSFRDTIVIATSNAGADKIREYIGQGMNLEAVKSEITNAMIRSGEFKPEFLNRFDEICIFQPLSKSDLVKVVDLMIASVNKTLAPQKISVVLTEDAKELLVERGYDPEMGARPMRRIVQKTVENLLARLMLSGAVESGATVQVTREMLLPHLG